MRSITQRPASESDSTIFAWMEKEDSIFGIGEKREEIDDEIDDNGDQSQYFPFFRKAFISHQNEQEDSRGTQDVAKESKSGGKRNIGRRFADIFDDGEYGKEDGKTGDRKDALAYFGVDIVVLNRCGDENHANAQ